MCECLDEKLEREYYSSGAKSLGGPLDESPAVVKQAGKERVACRLF